jgi:hypothetical protein
LEEVVRQLEGFAKHHGERPKRRAKVLQALNNGPTLQRVQDTVSGNLVVYSVPIVLDSTLDSRRNLEKNKRRRVGEESMEPTACAFLVVQVAPNTAGLRLIDDTVETVILMDGEGTVEAGSLERTMASTGPQDKHIY